MENQDINGNHRQESAVPIRVSRETRAKIENHLERINKEKEYGRPIKIDAYIAFAITLVETKHDEVLKEASLTNQERLERKYHEYVSRNGAITKDDFFGLLLEGRVV